MRYRVMINVEVSDGMGWDETSLHELYDEVGSHFGDFSAEVKVRELSPPRPPPQCENCGESDLGDHWDYLDGPNLDGWSCQRKRPTLAQEVQTAKANLRDDMVLVHADGGKCHGSRLVNHVCPGCGICPDMQSVELWPPEQAK